MTKRRLSLLVFAFILAGTSGVHARDKPTSVTVAVTYDKGIAASFTGRVYLFLGRGRGEPRFGPNWFSPEPFYAVDVTDWKPGESLDLSAAPLAFPKPLADLAAGSCKAQAVMRINPHVHQVGRGAGNGYSDVVELNLSDKRGRIELRISKTVAPKVFRESDRLKEHRVRSKLLSDFHGRDVFVEGAVLLPTGFDAASKRKYPALYLIPGFGGTHHQAGQYVRDPGAGHGGDIMRIALHASCGGGHHVFADSANNGPWGSALVQEFIPSLEKAYPLVAAPTARFLSGISSGGWSSLWLQVKHPKFFGGVWSFAPDPVDFRDFQQINLYKRGSNMFKDAKGKRRPLARHGGRVMVWYDDFVAMEAVLGDGPQIRSFEWVFSPRGDDGKPKDLFDRATGIVDHDVAKAWERYDINLVLKNNWTTLKQDLAGKLNVYMGGKDTFYLDGATRLLAKTMKSLQSGAVIEVHEEHDHGSIFNRSMRASAERAMLARFRKHHGK